MIVRALEPHGFCAGVTAAMKKAETVSGQVYCLHELVHNGLVIESLKRRGMIFVESLEEVPEYATVLFSAHGVSPAVRAEAQRRHLQVLDATCPFVERVHRAAREFVERDIPLVVIGNAGHAEVRGIVGEAEAAGRSATIIADVAAARAVDLPSATIGVVSQTTMNADEVVEIIAELRRHFTVETSAEVCRATKVRQDAVKAFDGDALLVLGAANSSNTRRLCEVATCAKVFRAATLEEIERLDFSGIEILGVTSGASTPEDFFTAALSKIRG